jgi:hypothetical protein
MMCTNCGRPVAGPALLVDVVANQAVVHDGRLFLAASQHLKAEWVICPDCQQGMWPIMMDMGGFFRTVANGLAKTTGREAG